MNHAPTKDKIMSFNPEIHHRQSIRLKDYDYSQAGAYFVTVCTQKRICLFGETENGQMRLNDAGHMVQKIWNELPEKYPGIETDEFIVMPNHIHGIILINNCRGEVASPVPSVTPDPNKPNTLETGEGGETPPLRKITLGQVVAYFKYQSTKQINTIRNTPGGPLWQRNYYEHIIRNEPELHNIREYIRYNPLKWDEDEENPNMKHVWLERL
jgi:putative transposase